MSVTLACCYNVTLVLYHFQMVCSISSSFLLEFSARLLRLSHVTVETTLSSLLIPGTYIPPCLTCSGICHFLMQYTLKCIRSFQLNILHFCNHKHKGGVIYVRIIYFGFTKSSSSDWRLRNNTL